MPARSGGADPTRIHRRERLEQELSFSGRLKRGLLTGTARTSIDATDQRLLGRTYAIPFSRVWDAALDLVRGGLPRWHVRWWDEEAGIIQALSRSRFSRRASDVVIRIRLDEQAQTRVDLRSTSRSRRMGDFGSNTRLIGAFTVALDRILVATPAPPPEGDGLGPGDAAEPAELPDGDADSAGADAGPGVEAPDPRGSVQGKGPGAHTPSAGRPVPRSQRAGDPRATGRRRAAGRVGGHPSPSRRSGARPDQRETGRGPRGRPRSSPRAP